MVWDGTSGVLWLYPMPLLDLYLLGNHTIPPIRYVYLSGWGADKTKPTVSSGIEAVKLLKQVILTECLNS